MNDPQHGGADESEYKGSAHRQGGTTGNPHARSLGTRIREALPAAFLTLLLAVAVVPALEAVNWNSAANPLRVEGYGSIGDGYGSLSVSTGSNGTRFYVNTQQRLTVNAHNHKVYARITYQTDAGSCATTPSTTCSAAFYYWATDYTAHTVDNDYVSEWENAPVHPSGSEGRILVRMKLDIPWRSDPQSGLTVSGSVDY